MLTILVNTAGFDILQEKLEALDVDMTSYHQVVANAAANTIKDHLVELNGQRANALGGKRSNFYANAAESIAMESTDDEATVSVTEQGFALRYFGGEVTPVNAKALAIPARAEAYGLGPREPSVPELTAFYFKGQKAFGGLQDEQGRVWYWLLPSTQHQADPSVLPTEDQLTAAANDALEIYIESFLETP